MRRRDDEDIGDVKRYIHRTDRCGVFLYLIAKVELGLPLASGERERVADELRRLWLTRREYSDYRRVIRKQQVEVAYSLAKNSLNLNKRTRAQWVRALSGFPSAGALKKFRKRQRNK